MDGDWIEEPAAENMPERRRRTVPLTILVAEDNAISQLLMTQILQGVGHEVHCVSGGRGALEFLETHKVDLLFVDLEMPGMGGIETTQRIRMLERETGKRLPIVALTAHVMDGDRERCLAAGMDEYVPKPMRRSALFDTIAKVLPEHAVTNTADSRSGVNREPDHFGLVDMFVDSSRKELTPMRNAITRKDVTSLHQLAHGIAGAAGIVGAARIVTLATDLKILADDRRFSEAASTCDALSHEIQKLHP